MSTTALESSLPAAPFRPLVSPFETYHQVFWDVVAEPEPHLTSRTRMLTLSGVSLATLKWRSAPARSMIPETRGIVTDASMRLAVWRDRGKHMTAWGVALAFQDQFFGGLRGNQRVPLLGLDLIRATAELECEALQWFCDVPKVDDPYTFETVLLSTALDRVA